MTDKHTPVYLSPFRKDVCWHGLPSKKGKPLRYCGDFGEMCTLTLSGEEVETLIGELKLAPARFEKERSMQVTVFLCRKHRSALRSRGYVVTKVTSVLPD